MKVKKFLAGTLLAATLMFGAANAQATVINFDDLDTGGVYAAISDGYQGFNWSDGMIAWDKNTYNAYPGVPLGTTSGLNSAIIDAWNHGDIVLESISGLFDFNSVNLIDIDLIGYEVLISGYNGANLIAQDTIALNTSNYVNFSTSSFNGLDKLVFSVQNVPQHGYSGYVLQMDDLFINEAPVPEPSSMLLGLMGLGSMLGLRRKKLAA